MPTQKPLFYIGRYLVTGRLGSGGMGVVYLATDERLGRQVAIKRLVKNPSSSSAHRRIRQEALLLAQLNHSNVVQIYDVVEERDDVALVMEYVDGCSLSHWQRERNPGPAQKVRLLKQICNGLSRAHSIGIIHRDLKADNILIDSDNTAKIGDFGIAKNWREDSDLTREQHIAGSWGAMSPEQAQGQPLDNRSDLFSLGVLAYQLLCGQNPFGDNESPYVLVDRIVNSQHPPASKLNPELPGALSQLLDRLLAKDPAHRPLNAAAVAAELEAIAVSLENRRPGSSDSRTITITAEGYHRRKQQSGGKYFKLIAATAASLLMGGAIALFAYTQRAAEGKYIAVVSSEEEVGERKDVRLLNNNVLSAIKQGLANREGLYLVPYSESRQLRGQPLRQQAQKLNAQLLLNPSFSCSAFHCDVSLELIDTESFSVIASRSTQLELSQTLESRTRTLQQLDFLLPQYSVKEGEAQSYISEGDYRRYLELFERRDDKRNLEKLLRDLEALRVRAPNFPPLYQLYSDTMLEYRFLSRSEKATERLEQFLQKMPQRLSGLPEPLVTRTILAVDLREWKKARALLAQLKLILPDQATYYHVESLYHSSRDEYQEASQSIDRALALRINGSHLVQKAFILTMLGKMDEAKPYLEQALEINSKNADALTLLAANELDSGHSGETIRLLSEIAPDQLSAIDTLSLCYAYYLERRYELADKCFGKAANLAPGDADPLLYQSEIARQQAQPEKARQFAQKALATAGDRDDWEGLLMRARALAELEQDSLAVETLLKARRMAPDDLYVNHNSAQVYISTNDLISAKVHIRKSLELGYSPRWYHTGRFTKICSHSGFTDLREEYPALCSKGAQNTQIAKQ